MKTGALKNDFVTSPKDISQQLRVPGTYMIAGMSNSGKTVGCKKLLAMMPKRTGVVDGITQPKPAFDKVIVFSQTAHMTKSWSEVTEDVFPEPNFGLIAAIQKRQEEWVSEGKIYQIAFIFDDCAGVLNTQERSHPMNRLVTMSRHFNISLFFLVQEMTAISPVIRKNCHFVIVTKIHGSDYDQLFSVQTHYDVKADCVRMLKDSMRDYNLIIFDMKCYTERPIMILSGKCKLAVKKPVQDSLDTEVPREADHHDSDSSVEQGI